MKVVIGNTEYESIANLSFSPETDVAGTKIPVNEFWVDVHTEDTISNGSTVFLKDDLDNIWAKYWIVYAEHIADGIVRICGQSKIALLDRRTLKAVMYNQMPLLSVLKTIFAGLPSGSYTIAEMYSDTVITGFCPKQTARERLLWVCFVIGAYVKTYFSEKIEILPVAGNVEVISDEVIEEVVDETVVSVDPSGEVVETVVELPVEDEVSSTIPLEKTFWKPVVSYDDYVTKVIVTAYAFEEWTPPQQSESGTSGTTGTTSGTSGTTTQQQNPNDEYVVAGNKKYVVTSRVVSLSNPNVPVTAPPNEVEIEGLYLINDNNASDILSHLEKYYFNRLQVDLGAINNAEYAPGDKLIVYTDEDSLASGYVVSCHFSFGLQARSEIKLVAASDIEAGKLIIIYKDGTLVLNKKTYSFPVGFQYSIENPYIDIEMNKHSYVYRPNNKNATGTIASGENTNTQQCSIALDLDQETNTLHIVSVDNVTMQTSNNVSTVVIA